MSVVQIRDEGPNWATKALVDFLSPLISNAIQQQQQRDANRKSNAFLGEFAKLMNGGQQPTNILTEQGTDGWANALSQSGNSALGDFDNATAGIAPQAAPQPTQQQPQMTQTDFLRNFADLISNKRFSGMNTTDALNLVAPLMNASEAQRVHELQKELGLELGEKGSWDDYLKAYANGVNQGLANLDTLKTMIGYAQSRQPNRQPYSFNTGATTQYGSFNPGTGDYTQAGEYKNTLTPQQIADNDYRDRELATRDAEYWGNLEQNDRQFNATLTYNREQANRPKYTYQYGDDGRLWKLDQFGNGGPVDPNSIAFSNYEKQKLDALQNMRKGLIDRRKQLQIERANELKNISGGVASGLEGSNQKTPELQRIDDELAELDGQLKNIDDQINQIFQSKENPQQAPNTPRLGTGTDIGANMLGHANNGVISSSYGTPRTRKDGTKYNHTGTDYPAKNGTPILVPDAGTTLTVKDVVKGHAGYGNYVDLEGNLNGHIVWFRIGHMANDSIKVQKGQQVLAGDVIGGVGNTGNVRGKNGGYHMHLETKIDGKYVDPVKFQELITPYIGREITGQQAQKLREQQNKNTTQPGGKILYKHSDGRTVNEAEFRALQESRKQSPEQVREALIEAGFEAIGDNTNANTPSPNVNNSTVPKVTSSDVPVSGDRGLLPPSTNINTSSNITALPTSSDRLATQDTIVWRDKNGQAVLNADGEEMTQEVYEIMARKAENGDYREHGINSRVDLDAYITRLGGVKSNPVERKAVDKLNGVKTTQPDVPDPNTAQLPPDPKTSPERFPAPNFTDNINQTTDADTQELLNELNGVTQDESDFAEYYNRKLNRLMGNPDYYTNMMEKVRRERLRNSPLEWPNYLPPRDAFEPWNPYDFQRL